MCVFKVQNNYVTVMKSISLIVNTHLLIFIMQSMETQPVIPDRKLLARLVLIREEARSMMGGGILDERNGRGFSTLPESEVCLLWIYTSCPSYLASKFCLH